MFDTKQIVIIIIIIIIFIIIIIISLLLVRRRTIFGLQTYDGFKNLKHLWLWLMLQS